MYKIRKTTKLAYRIAIGGSLLMLMTACCREDIQYKYNIPNSQNECKSGMTYRSGGSGIVDRSGGSGIVDRDGNSVTSYCEEAKCPGDNWSNDPPLIDWHLTKGEAVVANRICLAP